MRRGARWSREIEEATSEQEEMQATIIPLGEISRAEEETVKLLEKSEELDLRSRITMLLQADKKLGLTRMTLKLVYH